MVPRHGHAASSAKLSVMVTDVQGVQRILTMLAARSYLLTHFEADEADAGLWRTTLDVVLAADQVDLLEARLNRLPSVLGVDARWVGALPTTA
ncbi:MAG: hypothetical protein JWO98_1917 [Frankiales bacterium]|nr:hypothetical protein [Frankiales bacterium]